MRPFWLYGICPSQRNSFLLERDIPDVEADFGPVLDGDTVPTEQLKLLDLPVGWVHLSAILGPRSKDGVWKKLFNL